MIVIITLFDASLSQDSHQTAELTMTAEGAHLAESREIFLCPVDKKRGAGSWLIPSIIIYLLKG
jgi:hypothetical protein